MSTETTGRRISRREFLRAAAVAAGGFASAGWLAACAPTPAPTVAPPPAPVAAAPQPTTAALAATQVQPTFTPVATIVKQAKLLHFWPSVEMNQDVNTFVEQQAKDVGKQNGFDVEVYFTPSGEETAKYQAALESNTLPDIGSRVIDFAQYYPMGKLLDLTDLCAEIGQAGGGWFDWALKQVTFDGRQYGLPFTPSPWVVFYNRAMIESAGFKLPFKDFDELLAFSKAYSNPDKSLYALGFPFASSDCNGHTYSMLWGFGGAVQDAKDNITLNTPEVVNAITWYTELLTKHKVIPPQSTGWTGSDNNNFYLGRKGPIAYNPCSLLATMRTSDPALLQDTYVGVLPPGPALKQQYGFNAMEVRRMFIFSTTKYPDEAKLIAKRLMSPDVYGSLLEKAGGFYYPSLKDIAKRPFFTNDPYNKAVNDLILPNGRNFGFGGGDNAWLGEAQAQGWWATAEQNIILKGVKPQDSIAAIAKQLQDSKDKFAKMMK